MIYLHLRMEQPLCVTESQTQGTTRRSLLYISGSALRGALAAELRATHPEIDNPTFDRYILHENARFYPLYAGPDAYPLPRTAHSCKRLPGFLSDQKDGAEYRPHGVQDSLFPILRYQQAKKSDPHTPPPDPHCPECGSPIEPYHHFYLVKQSINYRKVEPVRRQIMKTAIDPRRETARPANLFIVEAVNESTEFAGFFRLGSQEDEEMFVKTVCPEGGTLRIGYGRTRGLGLARILNSSVRSQTSWSAESLQQRLMAFQDRTKAAGLPVNKRYFAITLLSDTILLDPFLRPLVSLNGPTLAQEGFPQAGNAKLLFAASRSRTVSGWSTPHGLPTADDIALVAGSTFVFKTDSSIAELLPGLQWLEKEGFGERKSEGFGQVVVCHPFHLTEGSV